MAILYCCPHSPADLYRQWLTERFPSLAFHDATPVDADIGDRAAIRYALVWHPPEGLIASLPNLRAVFNLGAGVDGLLATPTAREIPDHVPLIRLGDAGMAEQMTEWVLHGVLRFHRRFDDYERQQTARQWTPLLDVKPAGQVRVGLLGLGALGGTVAHHLKALGYAVRGWSRRPKTLDGIETFAGRDALPAFLAETDILVCLLPLTSETRGLLNTATLSALPRGAALINAARGAHVVDADLIHLLDSGHLRGAQLDVLDPEPPSPDHPFWTHPRVRLTPHIAAITLPKPACDQIADAITLLERGQTPPNVVDRQNGY